MNAQLQDIFKHNENRYLHSDEVQQIMSYAQTIPSRLNAVHDIQAKEAQICRACTDRIIKHYPNVGKRIHGYEKTERDLILILRYCAQAYLRNDLQFLEDQLLRWLATILQAYKFGDQVLKNSYIWLKDECKTYLEVSTFQALEPYLDQVIAIIPERAVA